MQKQEEKPSAKWLILAFFVVAAIQAYALVKFLGG